MPSPFPQPFPRSKLFRNLWTNITQSLRTKRARRRLFRRVWFRAKTILYRIILILLGLTLIATISAVAIYFFSEMRTHAASLWRTLGKEENNRAGLFLLAAVGILLAVWRSLVAERQVRIARENQAIERYQKAIQMLDSDKLTVRLGGIYLARDLAFHNPEAAYITVQSLLCHFIKSETAHSRSDNSAPAEHTTIEEDVVLAIQVMSELRRSIKNAKTLEKRHQWKPDLRGCKLDGLSLDIPIDLSGALLHRSSFRNCVLGKINLDGAHIQDADLEGAFLDDASMISTYLGSSNLRNASLNRIKLIGGSFFQSCLASTSLIAANLNGSNLNRVDLSNACLYGARACNAFLTEANLCGADLTKIAFRETEMSSSEFSGCKGLTQEMLDRTWAWYDRPPLNVPDGLSVRLFDPGPNRQNEIEHYRDAPVFNDRYISVEPDKEFLI